MFHDETYFKDEEATISLPHSSGQFSGQNTVFKHYLEWDKNVYGPTAKKAPEKWSLMFKQPPETGFTYFQMLAVGFPPTVQAFFHMNRHKFKPCTSFNLDAPTIKLYVDTTKDCGSSLNLCDFQVCGNIVGTLNNLST